jgi:hypothetical protein
MEYEEQQIRKLFEDGDRALMAADVTALSRIFVAIVHGSEQDEVEQGGQRFPVSYLYMDVVVKRDGKWQIVASQLARPS